MLCPTVVGQLAASQPRPTSHSRRRRCTCVLFTNVRNEGPHATRLSRARKYYGAGLGMLQHLMAQRGQNLTVYVGLKVIAVVVDEGLKSSSAAASWAQSGFVPGRRLNRDKLFVDRKAELFRSLRDTPGDAREKPRKPSLAATVLPEKKKCRSCQSWLQAHMKFCQSCSKPNEDFDPQKEEPFCSGHRRGWKKTMPIEYPELGKHDSKLLSQLGDLMGGATEVCAGC